MSVEGRCPTCGSPISFAAGDSLVAVCSSCRSIVARTDRALESVGRSAELAASRSPLKLGLTGRYEGQSFRLMGRAQLRHAAGGMWEEWYAAFGDGRWGWLAEAMGRFFLTFEAPRTAALPAFGELQLARRVPRISGYLTVQEKGFGIYEAAEGEIPFLLQPGTGYFYADLSGEHGQFGTLDYSGEEPTLYVGREVTLGDIGLEDARPREAAAQEVGTAQLACPQCGGALDLRAPDKTERIWCPYCGAGLDVNAGQLIYLKTLPDERRPKPRLPLGATAEFEGAPLTVIGFMVRSAQVEGTWYPWHEYLLYHPRVGYRFLVCSDDHWTWVRAAPPGAIHAGDAAAYYQGQVFKRFQVAPARVDYVAGEFYWKVEAGELAQTADYVRAPRMLSMEILPYAPPPAPEGAPPAPSDLGEVAWSLAEYVPVAEVERKFNVKLTRPRTVGPCQPFAHGAIYKYCGWLSLAALAVVLALAVIRPSHEVLNQTFQFPAQAKQDEPQVQFVERVAFKGWENISVTVNAPGLNNNWVFLQGDLVRDNAEPVVFAVSIECYHGVEDGESWSEGGPSEEALLPALPTGDYSLRLAAQWGDWSQPRALHVVIRQDVFDPFLMVMLLLGVWLIPLIVGIAHLSFEQSRWSESMFGS